MKKQFAILALFGVLTFGSYTLASAQEGDSTEQVSEQAEVVSTTEEPIMDEMATEVVAEDTSFHQRIKEKFMFRLHSKQVAAVVFVRVSKLLMDHRPNVDITLKTLKLTNGITTVFLHTYAFL